MQQIPSEAQKQRHVESLFGTLQHGRIIFLEQWGTGANDKHLQVATYSASLVRSFDWSLKYIWNCIEISYDSRKQSIYR